MSIVITSVEFKNYKAFGHFSISLQDINILVGPNNCGKSTIISAFRVLATGMRRARSQNPERVVVGENVTSGYPIPFEQLDVSIENVHTDYAETDTSISFRLSNGNKLHIYFPQRGGCVLSTRVSEQARSFSDGIQIRVPDFHQRCPRSWALGTRRSNREAGNGPTEPANPSRVSPFSQFVVLLSGELRRVRAASGKDLAWPGS